MYAVTRDPLRYWPALMLVLVLSGCAPESEITQRKNLQPQPPLVTKIPKQLTIHGDKRTDNYYWIRDDNRSNADVFIDALFLSHKQFNYVDL